MERSKHIIELVESYCRLIESIERVGERELEQLAHLLGRLHAEVGTLGKASPEEARLSAVDLDARFELFSHLHALLGDYDRYWMEFDAHGPREQMSGSLADDLTDIYCELKPGLNLLEEEPRRALESWRHGFHLHWGEHMVDAIRHLHRLRLQLPAREASASRA